MSKKLTILIMILIVLCVFMIYFFWESYNSFQRELVFLRNEIAEDENTSKINEMYDQISNFISKNNEKDEINPTSGEGVRIRIDSGYVGSKVLHDTDILSLLNELYLLDITEIEVNNIKIIPYSTVRCVGPTISINDHPTQISPVIIEVIGDPDYIISGLSLLKESFKERGIDVSMLALDYIQIGDEGS